ncbi:MAG: hypothetical protein IKZ21_06205 [Clostridia bacterium]|nr:hypothetical protein [Clostridia bacterium]
MKHILAFFLFVLVLISFCACSQSEGEGSSGAPLSTEPVPATDELFENPPKLQIRSGTTAFDTLSGTSSWSYHVKGDQWCSLEIDCDHPLNIPEHTEAIPLSDGKVSLSFELPPDNFKISYWPLSVRESEEFLNYEFPDPVILFENQTDVTFCDGTWIYEVEAIWNADPQRNCYGTVRYSFWATVE